MGNEVYSAVIAIGLGAVVGLALFVPFVAVSYRRRGGLTLARVALWVSALVYFMAIWTYTLLPLPTSADFACAGVNLDLAAFIDDLRGARRLSDPAVLQLALNVLLFVPLGFFLRVLGGRGIVVALLAGVGTSLVIETTQLTGVWGIYPCAYRVFDVDDLLMNTAGAVLGSLFALVVPRAYRGARREADAGEPRPVTRGRRLLAAFCDLLGAGVVAIVAGLTMQVWLAYVVRDDAAVVDGTLGSLAAALVPIALWALITLGTGGTPGDLAVALRYRGGPLPQPIARPLRFAFGIGGYLLLGLLPAPWSAVQWVFAVASLVLVFTTMDGRGLPGLASRQRVVDARASATSVDPTSVDPTSVDPTSVDQRPEAK